MEHRVLYFPGAAATITLKGPARRAFVPATPCASPSPTTTYTKARVNSPCAPSSESSAPPPPRKSSPLRSAPLQVSKRIKNGREFYVVFVPGHVAAAQIKSPGIAGANICGAVDFLSSAPPPGASLQFAAAVQMRHRACEFLAPMSILYFLRLRAL